MPTNDQEYFALREAAGLSNRSARGRIAVAGDDRLEYLQGLLTNDIAGLEVGNGCYAAFLTPQGRMITDLHVFNIGDRILLDVDQAAKDRIVQRLSDLVFTEDVQVADLTDTWSSCGVHGPRALSVVETALEAKDLRELQVYQSRLISGLDTEAFVARTDELGIVGYTIFIERGVVAALHDALVAAGGVGVGVAALEIVRVEAGRPRFGIDMGEDTIPLEAGIEDRAISFTKGCYVGQEVIVRILHRGQGRVSKKLVGLKLETLTPASDGVDIVPTHGATVWSGNTEVGRVTSAVFSSTLGTTIALGYVRRDLEAAETRVEVTLENRRVLAVVTALPFVGERNPK